MPAPKLRIPFACPLLTAACAALASACGTTASAPQPPAGAAPTAAAGRQREQDERMAWWREARFGMFLHWGLYAIPAGAWNGNRDHGEWIRTTAQIPLDEYAKFQQQWRPERFDANAWAQLAADAGMQYVVITSKHHDGFCLWDSAETDWDVGNTPDGRDILRLLADACRSHGIRFCTYHSIMDWHHPDYLPRRDWETDRPTAGADFERFERYLHAQVKELTTRYQPAVMWFDGEWENTWTHARGVELFELCRRLAPAMIVNNRVDVHRGGMAGFSQSREAVGDFDTPEQEIPATGLPGVDWESCMTMNRHWGWNAADTDWKSPQVLLRNLIDIASKGGNYLLNVGPRADGTFPEQAVERLRAIATWMRTNGAAIHGTTASVFDDLPFGRCTVKAGETTSTLYLHVFDWPADGRLVLPGLGNTARRAWLLAAPDQPLAIGAHDGTAGVVVRVPARAPDAIASVVAVEIDGPPLVFRAPTIAAESQQFVTGVDVTVAAASPAAEVRYTLDGSDPVATSPRAAGPIRVTATCTVRAAMFHRGRRVSDVVERTFTAAEPLPPVEAAPRDTGLAVERCDADWSAIPADRTRIVGTTAWTAATVALPPRVGERVALKFRGFVTVPASELYRFALASDDGSRLWIDGQLVVDNDGLHGTVEKRGEIALAAGLHSLELVWFNRTGGAELGLQWALPGQPFEPVPAAALRH